MPLQEVDPDETCALALIAEPLVWVTHHLRERVHVVQTTATSLSLQQRQWRIDTEHQEIVLRQRDSRRRGRSQEACPIPTSTRFPSRSPSTRKSLRTQPLDGATVAVFGSSHSSMIVLPHLLRHPVERVINFYRSPLKYAVYLDDWILFDDTGLKGRAAVWARENIDGEYPDRLERCWVSSPEFEEKLGRVRSCRLHRRLRAQKTAGDTTVGRAGLQRNNGILAPGLFGLGIAFPEYAEDPYGFGQYRVGLKKFMDYLNSCCVCCR